MNLNIGDLCFDDDDDFEVLEDKVYSWHQLLAIGFDLDRYKWMDREGEFIARIEAKCWGRRKLKGSIVVSMVLLEDCATGEIIYEEVCTPVFKNAWSGSKYKGMAEVPLDSLLRIAFKRSKTGHIYIENCSLVEES